MRFHRVIFIATSVLALTLARPMFAQEVHHHEGQSEAVDSFYSTWRQPDAPDASCCDRVDCYATEIQRRGRKLFARIRETGDFVEVPPEKIEKNRDNPDGRNHLCANPAGYVHCFIFGGGT